MPGYYKTYYNTGMKCNCEEKSCKPKCEKEHKHELFYCKECMHLKADRYKKFTETKIKES